MILSIKQRLSEDTGFHITNESTQLYRLINRAIKEVYSLIEVTDIYREMTVMVPANSLIALPNSVGHIRGVRESNRGISIPVDSLGNPRYVSTLWAQDLRRWWRNYGYSPIHTAITDAGPLTITAPYAETPNVTLNIVGKTANSNSIAEAVAISSTSVTTTNNFSELFSIACSTVRAYDITILDLNGIQLAILPNNQLNTRYRIIDVSNWPWPTDDASTSTFYCDIQYKIALQEYSSDSQEFCDSIFDDVIYYKAMEYWTMSQDLRKAEAVGYYTKCLQALSVATRDAERGEVSKFSVKRHVAFDLIDKTYYNGVLIERL